MRENGASQSLPRPTSQLRMFGLSLDEGVQEEQAVRRIASSLT